MVDILALREYYGRRAYLSAQSLDEKLHTQVHPINLTMFWHYHKTSVPSVKNPVPLTFPELCDL